MRFIIAIGQNWGKKWQRAVSASLTIVLLSAAAAAVVTCFGSEVLAAWKTPEKTEQSLASLGTFNTLVNFETPARTVARFRAKTREAQLYHARMNLAAVLKHWENTSFLSSLTDIADTIVNKYIKKYLIVDYLSLKTSSFSPSPSSFQPDPFTGNIHSINEVSQYDISQLTKLVADRNSDVAQYKSYALDEFAAMTALATANYGFAVGRILLINKATIAAATFALGFFPIGTPLAALVIGAGAAADYAVINNLKAATAQNAANYVRALQLANAVLNQHLAGDVFNPLVPATPYQ